MTVATSVGFMLCAILGTCFAVTIWDIFRRLDDHDEQLANLQIIVAGWLPEEVDELDEPTKACIDHECVGIQVCPRCGGDAECAYDTCGCDDEPPTEEIPVVQPETVPMARAWDESAAQLVEQAEVQTVEREFHGQTFRFREEAA